MFLLGQLKFCLRPNARGICAQMYAIANRWNGQSQMVSFFWYIQKCVRGETVREEEGEKERARERERDRDRPRQI